MGTKWGIAVGLYAVKCVKDLGLPVRGDVILESVVDEEFGGSHGVLASRLRGYNADFAINSEPTNMTVAPAHRGGGEWRITVKGDAGMDFGDRELTNPVYKLARVVDAIRAFDVERNRHPQPPPFFENDPTLPSYTMQIGGGDSYAKRPGIPPECDPLAWIEEFPGVSREEHVARFTGFVNDYLARDPDFDGVYPDYTPTIRYLPGVRSIRPTPFSTSSRRPTMARARSIASAARRSRPTPTFSTSPARRRRSRSGRAATPTARTSMCSSRTWSIWFASTSGRSSPGAAEAGRDEDHRFERPHRDGNVELRRAAAAGRRAAGRDLGTGRLERARLFPPHAGRNLHRSGPPSLRTGKR